LTVSLATARIAAPASELAPTNTSPSSSVPDRVRVALAVAEPLLYSRSVYCERSTGAPVPLKISIALLELDPSTYSEKKRSSVAACAGMAPTTRLLTSRARTATAAVGRRRTRRTCEVGAGNTKVLRGREEWGPGLPRQGGT
jgi:hypothetical protein